MYEINIRSGLAAFLPLQSHSTEQGHLSGELGATAQALMDREQPNLSSSKQTTGMKTITDKSLCIAMRPCPTAAQDYCFIFITTFLNYHNQGLTGMRCGSIQPECNGAVGAVPGGASAPRSPQAGTSLRRPILSSLCRLSGTLLEPRQNYRSELGRLVSLLCPCGNLWPFPVTC